MGAAIAFCLCLSSSILLYRCKPCGKGVPVSPTFNSMNCDFQNTSADISSAENNPLRGAIIAQGPMREDLAHRNADRSKANIDNFSEHQTSDADCDRSCEVVGSQHINNDSTNTRVKDVEACQPKESLHAGDEDSDGVDLV